MALEDFIWKYHTFEEEWSDTAFRMGFGNNYEFTAAQNPKMFRIFTLKFPGLCWWTKPKAIMGRYTGNSLGLGINNAMHKSWGSFMNCNAVWVQENDGTFLPRELQDVSFSYSFYVPKTGTYRVRSAVDDWGTYNIDGVVRQAGGLASYVEDTITLTAGMHNIVLTARNRAGPDETWYGTNPAGVACSILRSDNYEIFNARHWMATAEDDPVRDETSYPELNVWQLRKFYVRHGTHLPFNYPAPFQVPITVKFHKPLKIPEGIPDGNGWTKGFDVQLREVVE